MCCSFFFFDHGKQISRAFRTDFHLEERCSPFERCRKFPFEANAIIFDPQLIIIIIIEDDDDDSNAFLDEKVRIYSLPIRPFQFTVTLVSVSTTKKRQSYLQ